jgi:hypothetical protein
MPIVDGLTSTKMIRSHEKTNPSHKLSERAALNGRIPIIAVSASLVERERQTYMDAGFDAWILKPISFDRLQTLLAGIVDSKTREECLYKPGSWEQGGWFEKPHQDGAKWEAKSKPDETKAAFSAASVEAKGQVATDKPDPTVKDEGSLKGQETVKKHQGRDQADEGVEARHLGLAPMKSASAPAAIDEGSHKTIPKTSITDEQVAEPLELRESPLSKPAT